MEVCVKFSLLTHGAKTAVKSMSAGLRFCSIEKIEYCRCESQQELLNFGRYGEGDRDESICGLLAKELRHAIVNLRFSL